ncbi:MAG: DEAD/DEAH box helicase, partial [Desulfosalsimonas sp.]
MDFKEFQLDSRIEAAIRTAGFTAPTPVQVQTISRVKQGQDVIGLAQTGTGKTAAYVLPLLHRLLQSKNRKNRALILAPTRELAEQIHQDIQTLGSRTGLKSLTLYGGAAIGPQIQALKRGVDIVVACPGRLIDHINRGNMDFSGLETLILDEADQMLDMGFIPDIRRILKKIPQNRQSLMFSATMRKEIRVLADEVLHKPAFVQVGQPAAA